MTVLVMAADERLTSNRRCPVLGKLSTVIGGFMKVEIGKLDGSFGLVVISMTAETNEDRAALGLIGTIGLSTTRFQIKRLAGNQEVLVEKLTLEECEYGQDKR